MRLSLKYITVRSLHHEVPLEKEMATLFNILALENPMDRGDWQTTVHEVVNNWIRLSMHEEYLCSIRSITSLQIEGETMEMVTKFLFLGSKITAHDDCRHEIKRHLLLGKKL